MKKISISKYQRFFQITLSFDYILNPFAALCGSTLTVLATCLNTTPFTGTPKILCKETDLSLDIVTAKPFRGNIFVKGRAKEPSCKQSYSANNSNLYSLSLGKCGMQRLRTVNPRGVNFLVTVIVSFHPAGFITKNDRAFHVKCFYMETDKTVSSGINISTIPAIELYNEQKMPTCTYSVRRNSPNGQELTFANVGEKIYHVWECTGAEMGMIVKNCIVTNGEEKHIVLDSNGCSTDLALLSQLQYDKSLMLAYAQSQAFKYADSNQLFFTCQITLCQKAIGLCQIVTPPVCNGRRRRERRSAEIGYRSWPKLEMDVASKELLIAGLDDPPTGIAINASATDTSKTAESSSYKTYQ
uniref:ZP domain-containing protein n=1 Tax=Syphacia muris TaxID=451379 RepID=A0A0N5AR60_9BILA